MLHPPPTTFAADTLTDTLLVPTYIFSDPVSPPGSNSQLSVRSRRQTVKYGTRSLLPLLSEPSPKKL